MNAALLMEKIESLAPLAGAAGWDHSGVQVAGTRSEISKVAVALDPSPSFISAAIDMDADFILTHHPLSLEPHFLDRMDDYWEVARMVLGHGAWLYAAHTSLDVQSAGPAAWLARAFGLDNLSVLEAVQAPVGTAYLQREAKGETVLPLQPGFGLVGDLPEALLLVDFQEKLASSMGVRHWLQCGPAPDKILRMAYCPGSGGGLWEAAKLAGASVYISGEIKHHSAVAADMYIMDVGHFVLEEVMMSRMAVELAAITEEAEVRFFPGVDAKSLFLLDKSVFNHA